MKILRAGVGRHLLSDAWLVPLTFALAGWLAPHSTAFQIRERSRFDALVIEDPSERIPMAAVRLDKLESPADTTGAAQGLRAGWQSFLASHGKPWDIHLDRRSGVPLLVQGRGITIIAPATSTLAGSAASVSSSVSSPTPSVESLETFLRALVERNESILGARNDELVLDRAASGETAPGSWQVVFDHVANGVPVQGERYIFYIGHGNLVAFGATRWTPDPATTSAAGLTGTVVPGVAADASPSLTRAEALARLYLYMGIGAMGIGASDRVEILDRGTLTLVSLPAPGTETSAYTGPLGSGYRSVLAWRLALRVTGEPGRWVGLVEARDGTVLAFHDDDRYGRVQGGVYPLSNDQLCPEGCEQAGYPMPFADVASGAATQSASTTGFFDCEPPEADVITTLSGPYVRIADTCGHLKEPSLCGSDLDLESGPGTDCAVPAGASTGDTHAARTGFYHLNRMIEKARGWLPGNTWLTLPLTDHVNITSTCNAFWNGSSVNFYRSGGGCRNTGEIASVLAHEWGHGLDENDGGGPDNPSEAYADITAFLQTHSSCIGRGLLEIDTCGGYGDPCLTCTGARDVDWDKRRDHAPSTPSGFLSMRCDIGGGPCGKEVHCESYVATEALWDLAARDLPASGVDPATAWQIVERLWYRSRLGSGGRAYNCALPSSDGCGAGSWFTKLRAVDDEDGGLANGTPHAAAIFAAFDRHRIACGAATDPTNQSSSTCPALAAPLLEAAPGAESASLSWAAVPGAAAYKVLRSDTGCATAFALVATVPVTSFTDTEVADGFPVSYAVQAVGASEACQGALSVCATVTPQPFAGTVSLDRAVYGCSAPIRIEVRDGNTGTPTVTVRISSTSEPSALAVKLQPTAPGSSLYTGMIQGTPDPPSDDGRLSLRDSDTIEVEYVDADDGHGNTNAPRRAIAAADCRPPLITEVSAGGITGQRATISWRTDEPATSVVRYGVGAPGPAAASAPPPVTLHAVTLDDLAECTGYAFTVESTDMAGNTAVDDGGGSAYDLATPKSTQPAYSSSDTPVPIPDDDPAGATSTITVEDQRTVLDVNVRVEIQHTFVSDLVVSLITPTGARVELSDRRGYPGRNFTGTLFDDEAPQGVAAGNAPFTGSFRPDRPLSAADGTGAAGEWKLLVVDTDPIAAGRIESWTLELTFADSPCGPHASHSALLPREDVCAAGGSGTRNGFWDGGERVSFDVKIVNDGSIPLTGVRASIVPLTPGITMVEPDAEYGALAPNSVIGSAGRGFEAQLPQDPVCGSALEFRLDITSDQGTWSDLFDQVAGRPLTSTLTVLTAAFGSGIPSGWTVINGGTGGGSAATWTTANPGNRSFPPPLALPVAIVDSDRAGSSAALDEQLITPVRNLTLASIVRLEFDQSFVWFFGQFDEKGDVDVRSSLTGGSWYNVLRNRGASSASADHRDIDITAQAAGAPDLQVRFHYYDAIFEYWWAIDNVRLSYTRPGGCVMTTCNPAIAPPPVPDGTFGAAMKAARAAPDGSAIDLTWDAATCPAPGYHVLFGGLSGVAEYPVDGAACAIGVSGAHEWTGVPPGNLWFLVVADNGEALEGTWGKSSAGVDRGGGEASRHCGLAIRDNGGVCKESLSRE